MCTCWLPAVPLIHSGSGGEGWRVCWLLRYLTFRNMRQPQTFSFGSSRRMVVLKSSSVLMGVYLTLYASRLSQKLPGAAMCRWLCTAGSQPSCHAAHTGHQVVCLLLIGSCNQHPKTWLIIQERYTSDVVKRFCYLSSVLTLTCQIDDDIQAHISLVPSAFGRLGCCVSKKLLKNINKSCRLQGRVQVNTALWVWNLVHLSDPLISHLMPLTNPWHRPTGLCSLCKHSPTQSINTEAFLLQRRLQWIGLTGPTDWRRVNYVTRYNLLIERVMYHLVQHWD